MPAIDKKPQSLLDLPDSALAQVFLRIQSAKDTVALQVCCKRLYNVGNLSNHWCRRLYKDFDLHVKDDPQYSKRIRQLYTYVASSPRNKFLGYKGVYTSGGFDCQKPQYWAGHIFRVNHWRSYCSANEANVDCVGLLEDGEPNEVIEPLVDLEHRNYIINRCILPLIAKEERIFNIFNPAPAIFDARKRLKQQTILERLTTNELEHRSASGVWLFFGVPHDQEVQEINRVRNIVSAFVADAGVNIENYTIVPTKAGGMADIDQVTKIVEDDRNNQLIGLIDEIHVSRMGHFSCPVRSGVILTSKLDLTKFDSNSLMDEIESLLKSQTCHGFDSCTTHKRVFAKLGCSESPRILGHLDLIGAFCNISGMWLEFKPAKHPLKKTQNIHPVVWFRFWNHLETSSFLTQANLTTSKRKVIAGATSYIEEEEKRVYEYEDNFVRRPDGKLSNISVLEIPLVKSRACNAVFVKFIDQVNLMDLCFDQHEAPNIDVTYCGFKGIKLSIPACLSFAS